MWRSRRWSVPEREVSVFVRPFKVLDEEKAKLEKYTQMMAQVKERLAQLEK